MKKAKNLFYLICDQEILGIGSRSSLVRQYNNYPNPMPMELVEISSIEEISKENREGKMRESLSAALGVPGVVLKIEAKQQLIDRSREIMALWENQGLNHISQAPDGEIKDEFREIMQLLGFKVEF